MFERTDNDTRSYVARQSFRIAVNDTDAAGRVIDLAVGNGATEVDGVEFTLSDERRREVRGTAIDRAVSDARSQAEAVASSTGLSVGDVRSVSVGGGGFVGVRGDAAGGGTVIEPGPVTVSVSVGITYNATGGS